MVACDDVRMERIGGVGRITLDRPAKLNALTLDMVRAVHATLDVWENDDTLRVVTLRGAGGRAFCAGGDIARLVESSRANDGWATTFWTEQYRLDARIADFPKPVVALMTGIVMGGGVGLSSHAAHRIVTDSTRLAMPELAIGLIPDVGATWLLSRAPGELGTYLALTGERIGAADAIAMDLADLYVPSSVIERLEGALAREQPREGAHVRDIAEHFAEAPGAAKLAEHRSSIDRAFAYDAVEEIIGALRAEGSPFALATARTIESHSPTSVKLALRALREARNLATLRDCLRLEYRIMSRMLHDRDFFEGARAVVIEKDRMPTWKPANFADVSSDVVDGYFAPLGERELSL